MAQTSVSVLIIWHTINCESLRTNIMDPTTDSQPLSIRLELSPSSEPVDVIIDGHLLNGLTAAAAVHGCHSHSTFWYRNLLIEPVYTARFVRVVSSPWRAAHLICIVLT